MWISHIPNTSKPYLAFATSADTSWKMGIAHVRGADHGRSNQPVLAKHRRWFASSSAWLGSIWHPRQLHGDPSTGWSDWATGGCPPHTLREVFFVGALRVDRWGNEMEKHFGVFVKSLFWQWPVLFYFVIISSSHCDLDNDQFWAGNSLTSKSFMTKSDTAAHLTSRNSWDACPPGPKLLRIGSHPNVAFSYHRGVAAELFFRHRFDLCRHQILTFWANPALISKDFYGQNWPAKCGFWRRTLDTFGHLED